MQVALLPIDEDRVWPPDLCQGFPVERDLSDSTGVELQSGVGPGLPKVAVKTVHLMITMTNATATTLSEEAGHLAKLVDWPNG